MNKNAFAIAFGSLLLASGSAFAQDDVAAPARTTVPPSAEETAPDAVAAQFSDSQIAGFAAAVLAIRDINADESLDEAQVREQAAAIVAEHGLDAQTYNAIGAAARNDPQVAQRIQLALSAMTEPSAS